MSTITLDKVSLTYPIYQASARSLRHSMLTAATGGLLSTTKNNVLIRALSEMSFQLNDGDRVGLIGHNGAGKSTLLKLLAGIYYQQQGTVTIDGRVSSLLDLSYGMEPEASGIENIIFRCHLVGLAKQKIKAVVADVTDFTEMGDYLKMPAKTYSSGMHLRLGFAISTAIKPQILLLDEIIAAGDVAFQKKARERMQNLVNQADILMLSSHNNQAIREFCNKAIWLEHGKIRQMGDVEAVLQGYEALSKKT